MAASSEGERSSAITIHVEKTTRGDGQGAEVKYSLASEGRTLLRNGDINEALEKLRVMLDEEMD